MTMLLHTPLLPGSILRRLIYVSLGIASAISFMSCDFHIRASADWAKQKQAGNSSVTAQQINDFNVGVFVDGANNLEMMTGMDRVSSDDLASPAAPAPTGKFSIEGGLEFIGKGAKYDLGGAEGKIHLNYLEVPVYATYNYPLGPGRLYGGLGPYLAYGIGGKVEEGGFSAASFGENNGGYKRFDAGLGIEAGYQYKLFSFTLTYDLGLANVAYASQDFSAHNRSFAVNVGYSFGNPFDKKK